MDVSPNFLNAYNAKSQNHKDNFFIKISNLIILYCDLNFSALILIQPALKRCLFTFIPQKFY